MADKKLFGQAEDNNPSINDRIAFGTDTDNARNMTFQNLLAWLESKLGFFKTANNLSEGNAIQMRNNLDVLSSSTVYYNLAQKPDFNQVIYKGNTSEFTPTLDYDPATKKYVEDRIKRNIGYYGENPVSLSVIITNEARAIYNFTLKVTSDRGITLPSKSVLDTYFGYSDGMILTINCHAESTSHININSQLIDQGGNACDKALAKGDTIMVMYVRRASGFDPNWQVVNMAD